MPVNMTAQWVERIKETNAERTDFFDEKIAGLGLRVSRTGKKVWFVQYRLKGDIKRRRVTLEPYPVLSLADARERASEVLLAAKRGLDTAAAKQEERGAPTFEWLAGEYIERYASAIQSNGEPRKRTWARDEATLRNVVLPHWGRKKVHEITRADVIALLDLLRERGVTTQANRHLALVRKVFNWAIQRGIITTSPCFQLEAPFKENRRDRVLSLPELRSIWAAAGATPPLMEAAVKLLILTAQRRGEVLSMRWSDLDLASGWWTIPAGQSKNKQSHRVPLAPAALSILNGLADQGATSDWVFPSPRKSTGKHIDNIQKIADQLRDATKVDFVIHDLRRTAASHMTGVGISRLVVSKLLNHKESGVTSIYDRHSYDSEKQEALEKWAKVFLEI